MAVSQISVFTENQPGHLKRILETLQAAGLNVRGFLAADTGDCGIVRFILDKPELGLSVLKEAGCAVTQSDVMCVRLLDKPGELARVMSIIADAGINVGYRYSLISTLIAIHVDDIASAEAAVRHRPIELISRNDMIW
jgi:hypothetical protein